jgi:hypothetical protein
VKVAAFVRGFAFKLRLHIPASHDHRKSTVGARALRRSMYATFFGAAIFTTIFR